MKIAEIRSIPDGRMRLLCVLNERQKEALRALNLDGLVMLNIHETELAQVETWIEYWFDKEMISEDDLRTQINNAILDSA